MSTEKVLPDVTVSLETHPEKDKWGHKSSLGFRLRMPTAMAERWDQGCHHPVPHPTHPDSGREPGFTSLILSPVQGMAQKMGGVGDTTLFLRGQQDRAGMLFSYPASIFCRTCSLIMMNA